MQEDKDALALADLRKEYALAGLSERDADADPFAQFARWFAEAQGADLPEPNAMTVATATPSGLPSARVVLLKGFDHHGFVFYTNYESRKGNELGANPHAALVFYWSELQRQVRVTGTVARVTEEESRAYFTSRPIGSRLGAWASRQSTSIPSRAVLEARMHRFAARYTTGEVPLPPFWGGYRVAPTEWEFWQGRPSRLHDRLMYTLDVHGGWTIARLSP